MTRRLLAALVLLLFVAAPAAANVGRAAITSFLLRDPGVSPRIKATIRDSGDHAGVDRILYGDLTGDGKKDEVVTIFSGGTAGDIAFYVLSGEGGKLHAIKRSNEEYKVGVKIVGGQLQVTRPIYKAADPNCCPSNLEITTYRWNGRALVSASRTRIKSPG